MTDPIEAGIIEPELKWLTVVHVPKPLEPGFYFVMFANGHIDVARFDTAWDMMCGKHRITRVAGPIPVPVNWDDRYRSRIARQFVEVSRG